MRPLIRYAWAPLIVLLLSLRLIENASAITGSDEMRVTLLGTGTPFPNAERFGSAILVEVADKKLLFDCGRGVVIRLTQVRHGESVPGRTGVSPKDIDGLFLTHFTPTMLLESRICGLRDGS
jgi:ribonuclease Z